MKCLRVMLLLVAMVVTWASADASAYTLRRVNMDIVAHENSVWDVTETLTVEFFEQRHGIYRYIPSRFHYAFLINGEWDEKIYKNDIRNVKVKDYEYDTDTDDTRAENTIIKIGSPDRYVEGLQTYVITYQIEYFDDRIESEDFLCHTLWGSGWDVPVDELSFNIKFDKLLPEDFGRTLNIYSGARGSNLNEDSVQCDFDPVTNCLTGHVANLGANHAITISSTLPQGYWQPEGKLNLLFYLCVIATIALGGLYVYSLIKNKRPTIVPTVAFYPPKGMNSAEVGKIIDDATDPIDLASLIPWLAHKGYITITEIPDYKGRTGKHGDLQLTRKMPLLPNAPQYQQLFMYAIFGNQNVVRLKDLGDRHMEMDAAKAALDRSFTGKRVLTKTSRSLLYWFLMLLTTLGIFVSADANFVLNGYLMIYGLFSTIAGAVTIGVVSMGYAAKRAFRGTLGRIIEKIIYVAIMLGAWGLLNILLKDELLCVSPQVLTYGSLVLLLISAFAGNSFVDTEFRAKALGQLLGLRDFIKTAELSRLKMLVDENPSYFYDVLPYAMVFGLSDKWAKQFASIEFKKPDWYVPATSNAYLSSALLASTLSTSVSHSIASAVAQASVDPTSSSSSGGFSGGGSSFSGGGGGGGGGGAW